MSKRPRRVFYILTAVILSLLQAACGNWLASGLQERTISQNPSWYERWNNFILPKGTYILPSQPQIVPDYNWMVSGEGFFYAGPNRNDPEEFTMYGDTLYTSTLCIWPAHKYNAQRIETYIDTSTGDPLFGCFQRTVDGVIFKFENLLPTVNYAFVVEYPFASQMANALKLGNMFLAPTNPGYWSHGPLLEHIGP